MHWFRRAFVAAATVWSMALLLAPVAAVRPQPSSIGYAFALVMYAAGSLICHQRPERSFQLFGAQLPVCARCMGIYAGAAMMAVVVSAVVRTVRSARHGRPDQPSPRRQRSAEALAGEGRHVSRFLHLGLAPRTVLLLSGLPAAATLLFEWATGHTPGNWTRAASGVPLGAAVAWIVSGLEISQGQERHE